VFFLTFPLLFPTLNIEQRAIYSLHGALCRQGFLVIYPSYLTLLLYWLRNSAHLGPTRITYLSKLIGMCSLAALRQRQLFWV